MISQRHLCEIIMIIVNTNRNYVLNLGLFQVETFNSRCPLLQPWRTFSSQDFARDFCFVVVLVPHTTGSQMSRPKAPFIAFWPSLSLLLLPPPLQQPCGIAICEHRHCESWPSNAPVRSLCARFPLLHRSCRFLSHLATTRIRLSVPQS